MEEGCKFGCSAFCQAGVRKTEWLGGHDDRPEPGD